MPLTRVLTIKMQGLGKRLRSGVLCIEPESELVSLRSGNGAIIDSIRYSELAVGDWGNIYERHVAQVLTSQGYEVKMHGLEKGFLDGGVDLIAMSAADETAYIQCKYMLVKKINRQMIEGILYKASSYLSKIYTGKRLNFWLVVPSLRDSFSCKKSPLGRELYPMAEYFLSKNEVQSKVRLVIQEIGMAH
ncbi:MAG: restriction endonuclease [Chlorobium sp.]|nr:restriction endonuclease [Chlorobium sp.]